MNRSQLEHIVRSAGAILGDDTVIILGSQAILATFDHGLPVAATRSIEADVLPIDDSDERKADLIDGTIGEGSPFHETFGIYADGIGEKTARLPSGWRDRLVPFVNENTNGIVAQCLDVHDLWISKALAGREKDREFCDALLEFDLVDRTVLHERLGETTTTDDERQRVVALINKHI